MQYLWTVEKQYPSYDYSYLLFYSYCVTTSHKISENYINHKRVLYANRIICCNVFSRNSLLYLLQPIHYILLQQALDAGEVQRREQTGTDLDVYRQAVTRKCMSPTKSLCFVCPRLKIVKCNAKSDLYPPTFHRYATIYSSTSL